MLKIMCVTGKDIHNILLSGKSRLQNGMHNEPIL